MSLTVNNRYRITPVFPMWNHDKSFHERGSRKAHPRRIVQRETACVCRRLLSFLMRRDSRTLNTPGGISLSDKSANRPAHPANNLCPQSRKGLPGEVKHGEVVGISSRIAAGVRCDSQVKVTGGNSPTPRRSFLATPNSYIPSKARGAILEPCPELSQASPIPINVGGVDYGPAPDTGSLGMNIDIWL